MAKSSRSNPAHRFGAQPTRAMALVAGAALAAAFLVTPVQAQSPYTEVDADGFWNCLGIATYMSVLNICPLDAGGNRLHGPYFAEVRQPQKQAGWCCRTTPYTVTNSVEFEVKGNVDLDICADVKVGVSVSQKTSLSTTDTFPAFPCGCMVFVYQQDYCVYVGEYHVNYCNPIFGTIGHTRRWWKHFVIGKGAPTMAPIYYASPGQCGCPTGTTYPNPNPQAVQPAGTLPPVPTRTQRPWDPGTDGNPPNPDGTWPTQGPPLPGPDAAVDFRIDLAGDFDKRKLTSALDLNLFECKAIVGALYDELNQTGPHAGWNTPATVLITDDIRLKGTVGSIIKQLRQFASDRVHSKTYGDFNGDGGRNAADYSILQDMVMNPPTDESEIRKYDLDGDDQLTSNDLLWWTELNML